MSTTAPHIIGRVRFKIRAAPSPNERALLDRLSELWKTSIAPEMDELFTHLAPPGRHIRLSRLHVRLPAINEAEMPGQLARLMRQAVQAAVEKALESGNSSSGERYLPTSTALSPAPVKAREYSGSEAMLELFLFFLARGHYPWWGSRSARQQMEDEVLTELEEGRATAFTKQIKALLQERAEALKRLFRQFPAALSEAAYRAVCHVSQAEHVRLADAFGATGKFAAGRPPDTYTRLSVILALEKGRISPAGLQTKAQKAALAQLVEAAWRESPQTAKAAQPLSKTEIEKMVSGAKPEPSAEALYIGNAGLVLFNPFLLHFFEHAGLLKEKQFADAAARSKGVHLLEYLASGREDAPEEELLLNKVLCGMPFEAALEREVALTDEDKALCGTLLQAVVKHWPSMQNTSADWLRQVFLLREGRLQKEDTGHILAVESKAQDILLSRLPWGFSTIKLSWMEGMLHTRWA
jgi:hypothetical protein